MQLAKQEGKSQPAENNKIGFAGRRAPNFSYRYLIKYHGTCTMY